MYSIKVNDCAQTVSLVDDDGKVVIEYSLCFLEYLHSLCNYLNLDLTNKYGYDIMESESEETNEKHKRI